MLILISFNLNSQDLDDDFISSLPDSIKSDVMDEIYNQKVDSQISSKDYSSFESIIKGLNKIYVNQEKINPLNKTHSSLN